MFYVKNLKNLPKPVGQIVTDRFVLQIRLYKSIILLDEHFLWFHFSQRTKADRQKDYIVGI